MDLKLFLLKIHTAYILQILKLNTKIYFIN